jgi:hypothetical protein
VIQALERKHPIDERDGEFLLSALLSVGDFLQTVFDEVLPRVPPSD